MTREEFRDAVYERDFYTCVVPNCRDKAVDAHHLLDRSLWVNHSEFGGYTLDNGVGLCEEHHKQAEKDFFPPQVLRNWAGIENKVLPKGFDYSNWHNKWGEVLKHPTRTQCKYPSTMYLPFSSEYDVTDRGLISLDNLIDKPLVITTKMDGSNCCLRRDKVVARNGDSADHISFDLIKSVHAGVKYFIPDYIQIFGEWLYAKHSIHYKYLSGYFQVFAVYNSLQEMWLSWEDTEKWAKVLGFKTVPVLYSDITIKAEWKIVKCITEVAETVIAGGHEGIVVRNVYPFHYGQFENNVAKYVRKDHVQTDVHWSTQTIVKNILE